MKKVKVYYGDLTQADFDEFLNEMKLSLTGNADSPDLPESLVDMAPNLRPSSERTLWNRQKMSSKCSIPISGLEPRDLYWLRFCYLTVEGEKDYNQPKSFSVV
jgi:hypothetical protein